ncbi:hypothetical protein D1007_04368 [Hordeum vulgare]|nr:hypothetical protein D1007_04368 [Hordeum vulgare]
MGPNTLRIVLIGIADKKDDASSSTNEMYLDCEAFLAIHRTISPEVFKSIWTCKSSHEVWTKLEYIYGGSNLDEDGIMMKELVHELFTLFDLKESTTTSISNCLHTSASSISQGDIKKYEVLLSNEESDSPKESSSTPPVHMCLMARGNNESLIVFIKKEKIPIPINPSTEVIDGRLVKRLRKLCGSGRKLVVGSAEYKRIIETKLGITCLHVDVPDCEVIICSRNKPPLLPEQQSEPTKDLELFLHQHGFDVNLKMVDETSLKQGAYLLHDTELCEKEYLKFFRLLLKDFMVTSEIDTKSWVLIHFATALRMICYPGASYEIYRPVKMNRNVFIRVSSMRMMQVVILVMD